jgi:tRNA pseudouridine38-40 synthase
VKGDLKSKQGNQNFRNIKLIIEYDGTNYHGWQIQTNALTIQEIIENKLSLITQEKVGLIASGRTDTGVHALAQVANFRTESNISIDALQKGLNSLLPPDIVIKGAKEVEDSFHARFSVKSKVYLFVILNAKIPSALYRNYSWFIPFELDIKKMRTAASGLMGRHDFSSFRSSGSEDMSPIREVIDISLDKKGDRFIHVIIEADGFLKYMVRNIVGTLVDVGRKRIGIAEFNAIFESKDRTKAGPTAPSQGLFLKEVKY